MSKVNLILIQRSLLKEMVEQDLLDVSIANKFISYLNKKIKEKERKE